MPSVTEKSPRIPARQKVPSVDPGGYDHGVLRRERHGSEGTQRESQASPVENEKPQEMTKNPNILCRSPGDPGLPPANPNKTDRYRSSLRPRPRTSVDHHVSRRETCETPPMQRQPCSLRHVDLDRQLPTRPRRLQSNPSELSTIFLSQKLEPNKFRIG